MSNLLIGEPSPKQSNARNAEGNFLNRS